MNVSYLFTSCINPWSMFKFLLLLVLMLMQVELDSAKLRRDLPAKWFLEETMNDVITSRKSM